MLASPHHPNLYIRDPINLPLLVGGLEHEFYFSHLVGNVIIPTEEVIFFRGVGQPPTRLELH